MTISTYGGGKPFIDSGKVRILAMTTASRVPGMDYPTAIEAGVPGFSVVPWVGISAPKGTPPEIVAILDKHIQEAVADPTFIARMKAQGLEPMPGSARQFKEFVEKDLDRYVKVIKDAGIKIE